MANRNMLHFSHLERFEKWMADKGFAKQAPIEPYEAYRARKGTNTVVIYRRNDAKEHFTIQRKDETLVRRFLRETKGERHGI